MHYRISDFEESQAEKLKKICHKYPLEDREIDEINEILMARNIDTLHLFNYDKYESNFTNEDSNLNVLLICQLPSLKDISIAPREEDYREILQTDLEREEILQEDESLAQTLSYVHAQASIAIRNAVRMSILKNYYVPYTACPRDNQDFRMSGTSRAKFFSSLSYALSHREKELQKFCFGDIEQETYVANGNRMSNYSYHELMKYSKSWKVDKLEILGFAMNSDHDQLYQNDHIKSLYFSFPKQIDLVKCTIKIINNMKSLRDLVLFPGEQGISITNIKRIFEALKTNNSISNFALMGDVGIGVDQSDSDDEDHLTEDDLILYFKEQLIQKNKVLESIEFCFDLNIAKNIPNQISFDEALEVNCFLTSIKFGQNKFSSENNQFLTRNLHFSNHLTEMNSSI